ncbi:MAG: hypothetical protein WCE45_02025 [Sedimentisphaerales bacterium]
MQNITLIIAIVGSVLALVLQPAYALATYVAMLLWYPDYLRVSIGTIDLSVGRIIVTVLLIRCLFNNNLRRAFVWQTIDTWVALMMAVLVGVYCITNNTFSAALENRGGLLIDTWFAYLAARLVITDKDVLIRFIKVTSLVIAPLAVHGIVEATTGWQPFLQLIRFRQWRPREIEAGDMLATQLRWGLTRAVGPFSHPIMFGNCFVMFLPLIWVLRHQRGLWGKLAYLLSGMVILGAISSMSSGPWGMLVIVVLCLILEKYKHWLKPILVTLAILCILLVIGSKKPYHKLLSLANLGQGDWYSRARLIDAAIDNIDEWWLAGYGGKDPGWGSREGGYFWCNFTDVNNEFILVGVEVGMSGVIALCVVLIMAFRMLSQASRQTENIELKALYWSLGSTLVGVIAAWQGVCFFGQMNALFYSILGIIGSSVAFTKKLEFSNQPLSTDNIRYQYPARNNMMYLFDGMRK